MTSVVAGIANVAVVTRFLEPHEFGQLAVMLVFASALTLVCNLGSLQGTFSWAYGNAADEDVGDGLDRAAGQARDQRRALFTGLCLTLLVAAVLVGVAAALAPPAADVLLDGDQSANLVVWAAAGGGVAAVWRLAANALRLERRPVAYLVATAALHLLPICAAVPLLAAGWGAEGVLAGLAAGNAAALVLTLALIRRSLRVAVSLEDARNIMRRGRALIPVVLSFQTIHLADVLLLSRFVVPGQVGLYRVANRIGAPVTYWTTSFLMAWGSLRRDPAHRDVDAQRGSQGIADVIALYFALITFGAVLAIAIFSGDLVRVAAPEYADAADLIPLTAAAFALHGFYVLVYRAASFPGRRAWFIRLSVVNAAAFASSALLWIPWLGAYGAPLAVITGWSVGIAVLGWRESREPGSAFPLARVAAGLGLALACFGAARWIDATESAPAVAVHASALLAYVLLVLAAVIPRDHLRVARMVWARPRSVVDVPFIERRGERTP